MSIPPAAAVSRRVSLQLAAPDGQGVPVDAILHYDSTDPYAVHLVFLTGADAVQWAFARELLTRGVSGLAGIGDVQVWPSGRIVDEPEGGRTPQVCISLTSPSGTARFDVPLTALTDFLSQTYTSVPAGTESAYIDIDAELAMLL
ncbi:MAG TPA: SsgA family sporulation/cell division regulator [Mycobacteriales bacterium]|jgi:hypothetical protein|nr:SsgA family sporulation/cell division regulator [Mycobacteriales bacterium]